MTNSSSNSILLIGESDVGKTHYGAQLLKRLMVSDGEVKMNGAATNLKPFEAALENLTEGVAAEHTPTSSYLDSIWPITNRAGLHAQLVWPDYGGEQIRTMFESRRVSDAWRERILQAQAWMLFVRLQRIHRTEDILSRPLADLKNPKVAPAPTLEAVKLSDQSRLVELMQMLLYVRKADTYRRLRTPRLVLLLTCWDELDTARSPTDTLHEFLPMLSDFVAATWESPLVMGLSALGRSLQPKRPDPDYIARGPENFGYVVLPDGLRSEDLTLPLKMTLSDLSHAI
jgi:hypothetical protein